MLIHLYDQITREYLRSVAADPDPLTLGGWLIPAFGTDDTPPAAQPGKARVFAPGAGWSQVDDWRGQTGYTAAGHPETITTLGPLVAPIVTRDPPPGPNYTWSGATWQPDIEAMRAAKLAEIDMARDAAIIGGFEFAGVMYDSDPKSIQRINGAVTLSMLDPNFATDWITVDNSVVTLNATQLAGLGAAAGQHEATQIFKARQLKNQALAATTVSQLNAITW